MVSFDLCVTASRRPDLLSITLQSFSDRIFSHIAPGRVFVNLDPIFGSEEDHLAVISVVRDRFPAATIFEPETACFGAAVKRLWSATKADYVFHMEDDWVANSDVTDEIFRTFDDPRIQQVSFYRNENWDFRKKGRFPKRKDYLRLLGIKLPLYKTRPQFTTSPSILRGEFARTAAALMDPAHDPEKQFYSSVNMALERFVKPYRSYIYSQGGGPVIRDIGCEWRDTRGIQKVIKAGISTWDIPA